MRAQEINTLQQNWFTVIILGGKTETKSSAKGNSYIIWNIYDLQNLERQQDISLFLFGSAYKSHWKSSEFQVFALIKPEYMKDSISGAASYKSDETNKSTFKQESQTKNWNSFASKKKTNQIPKLTLSVHTESQLILLGKTFSQYVLFLKITQ